MTEIAKNRESSDGYEIIAPTNHPFNPKRKSRKPLYPWKELTPGEGFEFRPGTGLQYARNQASQEGRISNYLFRVFMDEADTERLFAVRVDGIHYLPELAADGTVLKSFTERQFFYPQLDDPKAYQERQIKDGHLDRLKKACDHLSADGFGEWVDSLIADVATITPESEDAERAGAGALEKGGAP